MGQMTTSDYFMDLFLMILGTNNDPRPCIKAKAWPRWTRLAGWCTVGPNTVVAIDCHPLSELQSCMCATGVQSRGPRSRVYIRDQSKPKCFLQVHCGLRQ